MFDLSLYNDGLKWIFWKVAISTCWIKLFDFRFFSF